MSDGDGVDQQNGALTFLFTDVEGSTQAWERAPDSMRVALERHDGIIRAAIERHGGKVFGTGGDSFNAVFNRAVDAVAAAVQGQRDLDAASGPDGTLLRVRMGLHTGEAFERGGDYFGPVVNRAARVMAVAHGGQIVCSAVTARLVADLLADGVSVHELGTVWLKGLAEPESIHGVMAPGLVSGFEPLRSVGEGVVGNVPPELQTLFGRGFEVEELAVLLGQRQVTTLVGPGGVGKTALALAVAGSVRHKFSDGVWVVELAPTATDSEVVAAVARALGVRDPGHGGLLGTLKVALASQQVLVVLDNAEHVIAGAAGTVREISRACPEVSWLVTSRERLGIPGEHVVAVAPLPATGAESPAVELFVARTGRDDLSSGVELAAVVEICSRLDGLPLAIELAAARCRGLQPSAVAARLDDAFRLLVDRRSDAARQATLDGMIRWSYDLLTPREQLVFNRLSVFAGGFDLEGAEAVGQRDGVDALDVDDVLASLVDKSLVVHDAGWYRWLETTRAFAGARLFESGDSDDARRRHLDHYVALTRNAGAGLYSVDEMVWVERLDREWANVRAAFAHAMSIDDPAPAAALAVSLMMEIYWRRSDASDWVSRVFERFGEVSGGLLYALAQHEANVGRVAESVALCERALASADLDPLWASHVRVGLGLMTTMSGDHERGVARVVESLGAAVAAGDECSAAFAAFCLTEPMFGMNMGGEVTQIVLEHCDRAARVDVAPTAQVLNLMARAGTLVGPDDTIEAERLLRHTLGLARTLRNPWAEGLPWGRHALLVAVPSLTEIVETIAEGARRGMTSNAWAVVVPAVRALEDQGEFTAATQLLGALSTSPFGQLLPFVLAPDPDLPDRLRRSLGDTDYEHLTTEGRQLDLAGVLRLLYGNMAPPEPRPVDPD